MKRFAAWLLWLLIPVSGAVAADSIVVFNEIQYHAATNEAANEWVELHNQMAIDIDLSAWSLTGASRDAASSRRSCAPSAAPATTSSGRRTQPYSPRARSSGRRCPRRTLACPATKGMKNQP